LFQKYFLVVYAFLVPPLSFLNLKRVENFDQQL
jgi:hypothetical protein